MAGSFISCLIVLSSCSPSVQQKEISSSATVKATPAKVMAGPLTSKLHQTYVLDDNVEYAIDSVEKTKSLGQLSKGRTAGEGALFCIVRFHARNSGKESASVVTDNFKVATADGKSYSPSSKGKEAVIINGGTTDLFESTLEPGTAKAFLAIFELPVLAVKNGAELVVRSGKSGSADQWVVRLNSALKNN